MFVLILRDMREPNPGHKKQICWAHSREQIDALLRAEVTAPYVENEREGRQWAKYFRKGGPLEWMHRPDAQAGEGAVPLAPGDGVSRDVPYVVALAWPWFRQGAPGGGAR